MTINLTVLDDNERLFEQLERTVGSVSMDMVNDFQDAAREQQIDRYDQWIKEIKHIAQKIRYIRQH
jgi:hypothetical protein